MNLVIRPAAAEDAAGAASVHVRAWQTAYRGIIPDSFLDNMSLPGRITAWEERLQDPERRRGTFVALDGDETVGFAGGGRERDGIVGDDGTVYDGELYAIYLLAEYQGRGIGRALTATMAEHLMERGFKSMIVWVLEANPARKFYEALGGKYVTGKMATLAAGNYPEVAYGWPEIEKLLRAATGGK